MKYRDFLKEASIPESSKNGQCYKLAYEYQMKNPDATLVHGLVTGQGVIEGIVYNHAWCEEGGTIIDMTLPKKLQKSLTKSFYYTLGKIDTTFRYSYDETLKKVLEFETYGPWEKKLLQNKY